MEFGIQLVGKTPLEILDMAALAEKVGIRNAFIPDHFAMEPPGGNGLSPDQPVWEAVAILGAMAADLFVLPALVVTIARRAADLGADA